MKSSKLIAMALILTMLIGFASAVTSHYTQTPSSCPATDATNFPGQSCVPTKICGNNGGIAACYDTSTITMPSSYNAGYQSQVSGSGFTGYVLDCYNPSSCITSFSCGVNATCTSYNRPTTCNSITAAPCSGSCNSGYSDCNADGKNCECQNGAACSVGGLAGTISGCSGASCNCVVTPQNFITTTVAQGSTTASQSLLWGQDFGSGLLMNITNTLGSFLINNSGCIKFFDGTSQCTASSGTGAAYNVTYAIWAYNQSTPFYSWNSSFKYNYNMTIAITGSSYNASYAQCIPWAYNQSSPYDKYNYNMTIAVSGTSYNATYATWAYNQTGLAPWGYNMTNTKYFYNMTVGVGGNTYVYGSSYNQSLNTTDNVIFNKVNTTKMKDNGEDIEFWL